MDKILIIKHGALGDFVISMGNMRLIRELHPNAEMTLVTMQPFAELARQTGIFSDIIIDNRPSSWKIFKWVRTCMEIVRRKFDIIYDFQVSSRTKKRYYTVIRWFSSHPFQWAHFTRDGMEYTSITKDKSFGFGHSSSSSIPLSQQKTDLTFIKGPGEYLGELPDRYVLLIPGCSPNHPYKRWPISHYIKLVSMLAERGIHSVVLGTKTEAAEVNAIADSSPMAISFLNKSKLSDIPQIVLKSLAVVGNDTGPTHMAVLCNRFTVGLFCTKTENSAPIAHCFVKLVENNIADISPEQVMKKLLPSIIK